MKETDFYDIWTWSCYTQVHKWWKDYLGKRNLSSCTGHSLRGTILLLENTESCKGAPLKKQRVYVIVKTIEN